MPLSAEITCRFQPKSGAGLLRFLHAKYRALMAPVLLQTGQVEASLAVIHDFHRLTHVSALIDLLAAPAV